MHAKSADKSGTIWYMYERPLHLLYIKAWNQMYIRKYLYWVDKESVLP